MSVAFDGIDNQVMTFKAGTTVTAGYPVGISANDTVANAASGAAFAGLAVNTRKGHTAVQMRGFASVKYSGTTAPGLGWNALVADGSGGVRLQGSGETGVSCLVVNLDTTNKIAGLFL